MRADNFPSELCQLKQDWFVEENNAFPQLIFEFSLFHCVTLVQISAKKNYLVSHLFNSGPFTALQIHDLVSEMNGSLHSKFATQNSVVSNKQGQTYYSV